MFSITTTHADGKIVAKGKGRQATIPADTSRSVAWNAGQSAGTLLLRMGYGVDNIDHVTNVQELVDGKFRFTVDL